ncbi:uncharacterized protein M6B38_270650 [Iris pallida]|uniref:Uncharacterized protein n=1 Tax=Iris pallida TaxID=29817 RepID=A0AAX6I899_IRIPA|nr:uncharacterized protein M6B38_270650 [Iris pallida]
MEDMARVQIPAFGNWDYCDEMPITQYFESAMQAGLIRGHYCAAPAAAAADGYGYGCGGDADLFKVPVAPPAVPRPVAHHQRKVRKNEGEKRVSREQQLRKQGRVYDLTNQSSPKKNNNNSTTVKPKAVDEDLYKIPPELLHQKPKKKRLLRNLWSGCLGLNCIA